MKAGLPNAEDAETSQRTQKEQPKIENDFSHQIIGAAVEVQRVLGTGLLESAYSAALAAELAERGVRFAREVPISAVYKGRPLGVAYRADFVVEDQVLVEIVQHVEVQLPGSFCSILQVVAGRLRVQDGRHAQQAQAAAGFVQARRQLLTD